MKFDFKEIITATMVLFAVIDIIGSIPIVLELKRKSGKIESGKATLVAGFIMIVFLFIGEKILGLIGIDVNSFAVAGAFVLFFLALEMVLGHKFFKEDEEMGSSASIVPLAFPIIAGAGSITTILSLRAEYELISIVLAILINMLFVFFVLRMSARVERFLGKSGIAIIRKIFGVILLAIAVKLFTANIQGLIN